MPRGESPRRETAKGSPGRAGKQANSGRWSTSLLVWYLRHPEFWGGSETRCRPGEGDLSVSRAGRGGGSVWPITGAFTCRPPASNIRETRCSYMQPPGCFMATQRDTGAPLARRGARGCAALRGTTGGRERSAPTTLCLLLVLCPWADGWYFGPVDRSGLFSSADRLEPFVQTSSIPQSARVSGPRSTRCVGPSGLLLTPERAGGTVWKSRRLVGCQGLSLMIIL